jgi:hypothetical protein
MEILEAFDATGCAHRAGVLAGVVTSETVTMPRPVSISRRRRSFPKAGPTKGVGRGLADAPSGHECRRSNLRRTSGRSTRVREAAERADRRASSLLRRASSATRRWLVCMSCLLVSVEPADHEGNGSITSEQQDGVERHQTPDFGRGRHGDGMSTVWRAAARCLRDRRVVSR